MAEDDHSTYRFIGRADKLREAQDAWNEGKQIIGIYGFKSIGKTRFAKELLRQQDIARSNVYALDFCGITSLSELIVDVRTAVGIPEHLHAGNWIEEICRCLTNRISEGDVVLCIDNAEDVYEFEEMRSAFTQLCEAVIKISRSLKVVFTSTVRFDFPGVDVGVYTAIYLTQLTHEESKQLLRDVVDGLDLEGQESKLAELCAGLPLAIMIAGSELNEEQRQLLPGEKQQLAPGELVQLLEESRLNPLSRPHYADSERMGKVIGGAICRLCEILQQYYASINYIPGTFNKEAVAAVLDLRNNAQALKEVLGPLLKRCFVSYDDQIERYDIHAMQREFVMNNIHIRDILGVRTRFCQFYTHCLIQLQKKVDSKDSAQALVPINMELKNFKKLLETAAHSSGDGTFDVFMEAAMKAKYLIQFYMPEKAVQFYEVILDTCVEHGTEFDRGVLMSILGEVVSENKGDFKGGLEWYRKAEQRLLPFGASRQLAEVYQHIGRYYHTSGNGQEAVKHHKKSYRMLRTLDIIEDLQFAGVMTSIGVAYVLMGQANEAEKYHLKSLELPPKLVGEKHLNIATIYNSVGLMYELKEDYEKAIEYYEKAYRLKQELLGPSKTVLITMRNLCLQWVREGEYQKALDLVQENEETFDQISGDEKTCKAFLLKVQGAVYMGMGEYAKAEKYLKELLAIQKEKLPGHRTQVKTLTDLGEVTRRQGRLDEARIYLQEGYEMKSEAMKCRGKFLFENLREYARLYLDICDFQMAADYYGQALCELHRVGDLLVREKDGKCKSVAKDFHNLLQEIDDSGCHGRLAVPQPCHQEDCCLQTFADIIYGHHGVSDSVGDASYMNSSVPGHSVTGTPAVTSDSQVPESICWTMGHVYPSYISVDECFQIHIDGWNIPQQEAQGTILDKDNEASPPSASTRDIEGITPSPPSTSTRDNEGSTPSLSPTIPTTVLDLIDTPSNQMDQQASSPTQQPSRETEISNLLTTQDNPSHSF